LSYWRIDWDFLYSAVKAKRPKDLYMVPVLGISFIRCSTHKDDQSEKDGPVDT
jgi:hypothetical protein